MEIGYSFKGERRHGDIVPKHVGSVGGLKKIQDFSGFFDETTVVLCGDALFEHRNKGALASVVALNVPLADAGNYGIVKTDKIGRVLSFQEKPEPAEAYSTFASTDIYIFEPRVLDLVRSDTVFDIGGQLFPMMVEVGVPFYAQNRYFNWIDIGRVSDYWTVLQRVLCGEVTIVGPVYIGSGVHIEPGVTIQGPAWIGSGSWGDARVWRVGVTSRNAKKKPTCVSGRALQVLERTSLGLVRSALCLL